MEYLHDEVMTFIGHWYQLGAETKSNVVDLFTCGGCAWFAYILRQRFEALNPEILYNQIDNHFAVLIDGRAYDIAGEVHLDKNWMAWDVYCKIEPLDANRVVRDCMLWQQ